MEKIFQIYIARQVHLLMIKLVERHRWRVVLINLVLLVIKNSHHQPLQMLLRKVVIPT